MKMKRLSLKVVCILIGVVTLTHLHLGSSYLINTAPVENEKYPGYCFDSELNQPYKNGTINQRPGRCEIARCLKDLSIQIRGCSDPVGPIFCHKIPANYSLPYPHCCAKIACI